MPPPRLTGEEEKRVVALLREKVKRGRGDLTLHLRRGRVAGTTWTERDDWQGEAAKGQRDLPEGAGA